MYICTIYLTTSVDGAFLHRYVLFSIGNIKPLLANAFPDCWDDETVCNPTWIAALDYLEISGIIVGQIVVGVLGDWLGRRYGLIQDALIMFGGLLMLTSAWGLTMSKSNSEAPLFLASSLQAEVVMEIDQPVR